MRKRLPLDLQPRGRSPSIKGMTSWMAACLEIARDDELSSVVWLGSIALWTIKVAVALQI